MTSNADKVDSLCATVPVATDPRTAEESIEVDEAENVDKLLGDTGDVSIVPVVLCRDGSGKDESRIVPSSIAENPDEVLS